MFPCSFRAHAGAFSVCVSLDPRFPVLFCAVENTYYLRKSTICIRSFRCVLPCCFCAHAGSFSYFTLKGVGATRSFLTLQVVGPSSRISENLDVRAIPRGGAVANGKTDATTTTIQGKGNVAGRGMGIKSASRHFGGQGPRGGKRFVACFPRYFFRARREAPGTRDFVMIHAPRPRYTSNVGLGCYWEIGFGRAPEMYPAISLLP